MRIYKKTVLLCMLSFSLYACQNTTSTTPKIVKPSVEPSFSLPTLPNDLVPPIKAPIILTTPSPSSKPLALPSSSASPSINNNSSGTIGTTSDIKDLATFNGKVYDKNGFPLNDIKVSAKSIDPNVKWEGQEQLTQSGSYVFRNAPVGVKLEILAKKQNWTTRTRIEVLKSNLTGDPQANIFDFGKGGDNTDPNNFYYLQDEPEVMLLKINGIVANYNPNQDKKSDLAPENYSADIRGISASNVLIELNFSEAVIRDDVENYFRIRSQKINDKYYTINKNNYSIKFDWSFDDKSVLIRLKDILLNSSGSDEYKYSLDFTSSFRDSQNLKAISGNYFKFSGTKSSDFYVFSAK